MVNISSEVADLWINLRLLTKGFTEGLEEATAEAETFEERMNTLQEGLLKFGKIAALAAAGATIAAVKMAGDWQQSMIKLTTSAGEAGGVIHGKLTGEIANVSDQMLKMSVATGTSTKQLADAMYLVESAGYHGAAGLNVLKIAAEGAKAEGANVSTVANALTTLLHDMGMKATDATSGMNMLIATVARGKTTMDATAGAMGDMLAAAHGVGDSAPDILGAFATMTVGGNSANKAALDLTHTLTSIQVPTSIATKWLGQMGISAQDVKEKFGERGLLGTITLYNQAILSHMDKDGQVLISAFSQSKLAAQDLNTMLQSMPSSLRAYSLELEKGSITAKDYNKITGDMPANLKAQAAQFLTLYKQSNSFNLALKQGGSNVDTYAGMLRHMLGDQVDTNTALQIGGANLAYFSQSVDSIAAAGKNAGADIETWKTIQQGFNFQIDQARQAVATFAIRVGTDLLPKLMTMFDVITSKGAPILRDFEEHLKSAIHNPELERGLDYLKNLWRDFVAILAQARQATVNLWQAVQPLAQLLIGTFLTAIKTISVIVKDVIGPAFVAFTGVLRDNSGLIKFMAEVALTALIGKLIYTKSLLAIDMFKTLITGISGALSSLLAFSRSVGTGRIFDDLRLRVMYAGDAIRDFGAKEKDAAVISNEAAGLKGFGAFASKMTMAIPIIGGVALGVAGLTSWISHLGEKSQDTTAQVNAMTTALLNVADGSDKTTQQLAQLANFAMHAGSLGKQFIDPIDKALAGMVQSGHLQQAQEALSQVDAALTAGGHNASAFNGSLTAFNDAVGTYNIQQREAALATSGTATALADGTSALGSNTDALGGATDATGALADATSNLMQQQQDMTKGLEASRALDDFTKSIQDLTQSFKDNGTALTGNSKAALANRDALRNSVQTIIDTYNANLQNNMTTDDATQKLKDQIQQLINQSTTSSATRKAMQDYIDTLNIIPPTKNTVVTADTTDALNKINTLAKKLDGISGPSTTNAQGTPRTGSSRIASYAVGGFVTGARGAAQLAVVHGGEYVVSLEEQEGVNTTQGSGGGAFAAGMRSGVTIIVNNQGSVIAERDLRNLVETLYLQLGGRRSTSYTPYKR